MGEGTTRRIYMHTKDELEKMSDIELVTLASELGLQVKEDKLSTIYDIINKEAEIWPQAKPMPSLSEPE